MWSWPTTAATTTTAAAAVAAAAAARDQLRLGNPLTRAMSDDADAPGTNRPVRRGDWKSLPLPQQHTTIRMGELYPPEDIQRLQRGFMPQAMEDRWFMFMENNILHIHRSWTGFCVYRVNFIQEGENLRMISVDVNRDPEQYSNTSIEHDKEMVLFLLSAFLSVGHAPFPETPAEG